MAVEGPAYAVFPTFGLRLGDVVQQGCPSQPEVVALLGYLVEHLECVQEVVLVAFTVDDFHAFQLCQLREDELQQAAFLQ